MSKTPIMKKAKSKANSSKTKLNKTATNGKIQKKSKKFVPDKSEKDDVKIDDKALLEIKKKPAKADLKLVILALQKEPRLFVVRKALKYIPHYMKSQGILKKLIKEIIKLWSQSGEKTRVVCLLCLVRIFTKLEDKELRHQIVKKLYESFTESSKVSNKSDASMISFMRHSLVEIYKLDPKLAFKQAQTSCQQMAITIKNSKTHRKETTYKSVLDWQFAHCLTLWSDLVISQPDDNSLKTLQHQVIQMNLDAISLLSSPRYYSYYCHLIENLINLSVALNVFIPILPIILSILMKLDVEKDESILEKVYELLVKYLGGQCHKIAFPELVLLPCAQLKKWLKKNPKGTYPDKFRALMDKIRLDSDKIAEARRSVDFEFNNYAAVDAWEKKMRDSEKMLLGKHAKNIHQTSE